MAEEVEDENLKINKNILKSENLNILKSK